MEIPTAGPSHSSEPPELDPAADLDLLDRARSVVEVDQVLDFGPWWYAPLLATMIGGLTLFGHDVTGFGTATAAGVVALLAGGILAVHDYRRRSVRLRRSARGAGFLGLFVLVAWLIIGAWGTAVSSLGYERFVPGYAVLAWMLTTAALLGIRAGLQVIRSRRRALR